MESASAWPNALALNSPVRGVDHALAFDRIEQALERGLERPHADERHGAFEQHAADRARGRNSAALGVVGSAPSTATGRSRKRASSASTARKASTEPGDRPSPMTMPSISRALRQRGALIDAERAHHAHALADRDAQRRMMAAAADQQHGRIVERIAGRQFGDDVALVLERLARGRARWNAACAAAARSETRAINCSAGASSAIASASGSAGGRVIAHADDHRDEGRGRWRPGGRARPLRPGRRRPARTARWRRA